MIGLLIEKGANINLRNSDGKTALDLSKRQIGEANPSNYCITVFFFIKNKIIRLIVGYQNILKLLKESVSVVNRGNF